MPGGKLEVRSRCMSYGSQPILMNLDLSVIEGEFLSILGPAGCGKTTLLRILVGLLDPTSGSIHKDGEDITKAHPAKRGMGIVFQNYALFQNMTALGNVEYALKRQKETKASARKMALDILEQVNLGDQAYKRPAKLSGGQQQRVALARTLALQPEIVLLDEPMSALDADTRLQLRSELKSIQERFNATMVYITHDQEEAFAMSDRIMVLQEGRIVQLDSPEAIVSRPANDYVRLFVVDNLQKKLDSLVKYLR
jgi:ABC-type Fe3+/spermidine/putrescine transport system ATPase subunit